MRVSTGIAAAAACTGTPTCRCVNRKSCMGAHVQGRNVFCISFRFMMRPRYRLLACKFDSVSTVLVCNKAMLSELSG